MTVASVTIRDARPTDLDGIVAVDERNTTLGK